MLSPCRKNSKQHVYMYSLSNQVTTSTLGCNGNSLEQQKGVRCMQSGRAVGLIYLYMANENNTWGAIRSPT